MKIPSLKIACLLVLMTVVHADDGAKLGYNADNIVGVDQFDRSFNTIKGYQPNKNVGMFFWMWIGQPHASGIYDATKISAMPNGVKLLYDPKHLDEKISPAGQAHFWGEPIWGYYNSEDEWVLRRQIALLTIAGVDFIFFDTTNTFTYREVYEKILRIVDEYQKEGWNPPKVVFYTHSLSRATAKKIYDELYKPGLYPNTWYTVNGKPLIIAYLDENDDKMEAESRKDTNYRPIELPQDMLDFFTFKKPQWPGDPVFEDGFPWIEWIYPQPMHGDMMSVTVASHPKVPMSFSITRGVENWGRGWDPEKRINVAANVDRGTFFQLQFDHAIKSNPKTLIVGGWNEWIGYKQIWDGEYMLCDAADKEFSRDIEPMKGGYQDAFYFQLIKNIRDYKGIPGQGLLPVAKTIDINAGDEQWSAVNSVYRAIGTKNVGRDEYGAAKTVRYTQAPAANNILEVRVTNDRENLYFYIRCEEDIKTSDSLNWMNIFIGNNTPSLKQGWEGYGYVINRNRKPDGTASVEKLSKDFSGIDTGGASYKVSANTLQVKVPLSKVGAPADGFQIYFKVSDGVQEPRDIMNYYVTGSSLPLGRLSFDYSTKPRAK